MNGDFAIVDENMIVTSLWSGNIDSDLIPEGGLVKYSEPFQSRGTPLIGQQWDNSTETFI